MPAPGRAGTVPTGPDISASADSSVIPVVAHAEGVRVTRRRPDIAVTETLHEFGGLDLPAIIAGALAAVGAIALVSGVGAALAAWAGQAGLPTTSDAVLIAAATVAALALVASFFLGGWVAGRVARYDGQRNGLLAALSVVVLAAVATTLALFAGDPRVPDGINLPEWLRSTAGTAGAIAVAVVLLAFVLAAGWFGGRRGTRYHEDADGVLLSVHEGGIPEYRVGDPA